MKDVLHGAGILLGCSVIVISVNLFAEHWRREQMSREIDRWNQEEWKQNLKENRIREFMDEMDRKHS